MCVRVEKSWDERWFRVGMTDRMNNEKKKNKHRKDHTSCSSYAPSVTASVVKDQRSNTHCNNSYSNNNNNNNNFRLLRLRQTAQLTMITTTACHAERQ